MKEVKLGKPGSTGLQPAARRLNYLHGSILQGTLAYDVASSLVINFAELSRIFYF